MGLVDYSSGSDSDSSLATPAKRRKTSAPSSTATTTSTSGFKPRPPPPLPAAFHDLYASTVRVSTVDDPSLHQGRKRVNPHKVGNWPSHLYVDVQPTDADRSLLEELVAQISARLATTSASEDRGTSSSSPSRPSNATSATAAHDGEVVPVHTFLSSDLGAPQPLHISLSRPLSLQTAQKERLLEGARNAVSASGITGPFRLRVLGVYWHRTRESERSFLVLKIASDTGAPSKPSGTAESGKATTNPELQALLEKFNALAAEFNQPPLYAITPKPDDSAGDDGKGKGAASTVRDAFHVSIAWSPAVPTPRMRALTTEVARVYFPSELASTSGGKDRAREGVGLGTKDGGDDGARHHTAFSQKSPSIKASQSGHGSASRGMSFPVDAIKLKIGNVITSLPL